MSPAKSNAYELVQIQMLIIWSISDIDELV